MTDRYDPTLPPRSLIPRRDDIVTAWNAWVGISDEREVFDRHGRATGYLLSTSMRHYAYEATYGWDMDSLEGSTGIAQAFWVYQQEIHQARNRPLDTVMTPEEATDFLFWNTEIAGERRYPGVALPWGHANAGRLTRGETVLFSRTLRDAARQDMPKFWLWRATRAADQAEAPFVPPADGSLDVRDPRVRHLWVKSAEVARAQAMCGTYDKIAKDVGVPTRETLRRTGELKSHLKLTYTARIDHSFPLESPASSRDYRVVDRDVTGEQIREWLAGMDDTMLRAMFTVYDSKVLE